MKLHANKAIGFGVIAMLGAACVEGEQQQQPSAEVSVPESSNVDTTEQWLSASADTIDLYFQAYRAPIMAGGGRPDEALWEEANGRGGAVFLPVVHDIMDITFGFDFVHPSTLEPKMCNVPAVDGRTGNIRSVPDVTAALALLDSLRAGVRAALLERKLSSFDTNMERFWASPFGEYAPMHTGRCYPHGHRDYDTTPEACVSKEVKGLIQSFFENLAQERAGVQKSALDNRIVVGASTTCNCYYSSDCSSGQTCGGYFDCTLSGKKDGTCRSSTSWGGGSWGGTIFIY